MLPINLTCMYVLYFNWCAEYSTWSWVCYCLCFSQDSDITGRIKGQWGQSVEISVSAYIIKSAQLIRGCASKNPVSVLKCPSVCSVKLHGCCKQIGQILFSVSSRRQFSYPLLSNIHKQTQSLWDHFSTL